MEKGIYIKLLLKVSSLHQMKWTDYTVRPKCLPYIQRDINDVIVKRSKV